MHDFIPKLKKRALRWSLPLPFSCRHIEYSTIASVDDDLGRTNERLINTSLKAIEQARQIDLAWLSDRMAAIPFNPNIWPGEHYRLLAGLVAARQPQKIIEVGTFQGVGALSLKSKLPAAGEIITIDIVPWNEIPNTAFRHSDFEDGRLRQVIGDLSDSVFFNKFSETLAACDLLFIDGPKNVIFEQILLNKISSIHLKKDLLVVLDDIRQWNMLQIWRDIHRPKFDLTSFGHWTGTGLIDWNG